jgi:hypothetical protein
MACINRIFQLSSNGLNSGKKDYSNKFGSRPWRRTGMNSDEEWDDMAFFWSEFGHWAAWEADWVFVQAAKLVYQVIKSEGGVPTPSLEFLKYRANLVRFRASEVTELPSKYSPGLMDIESRRYHRFQTQPQPGYSTHGVRRGHHRSTQPTHQRLVNHSMSVVRTNREYVLVHVHGSKCTFSGMFNEQYVRSKVIFSDKYCHGIWNRKDILGQLLFILQYY